MDWGWGSGGKLWSRRWYIKSTPKFVILNLFQDNKPPQCVILKQVQDDDDLDFQNGAMSVRPHHPPPLGPAGQVKLHTSVAAIGV
jgi:hypothetical protein